MRLRHIALSIALLVLGALSSIAQDAKPEYEDFTLAQEPGYNDSLITDDEKAHILLKKQSSEYIFKAGQLVEYYFVHKRLRLLTDDGIEMFNKVYIPVNSYSKLVDFEARVIKSDGSFITIHKDAIKEGKDEDSDATYHYFAFEGLQLGNDVEFFYRIEKSYTSSYQGSNRVIQTGLPQKNVCYEIWAPWNLVFKFQSENGLPEVEQDTAYKEKNKYSVSLSEIPAFKKDKNSRYTPHLQYFIFKLDQNLSSGVKDIVSYGKYSQAVYENIYKIEDKAERKYLAKFIKEMDIDERSDLTKIRSIENYIKDSLTAIDRKERAFSTFEFMYNNKAYNESGSLQLFANILKELDVEHQFVFTCSRNDVPFHKTFEANHLLDKTFLYFPSVKKYTSPYDAFVRLGYIPSNYMNTYGLFVKGVEIGDVQMGIGKIKKIKPIKAKDNQSNHYISVDFTEEFISPIYKVKCEAFGYTATLQILLDYIKEEDEKVKSVRSLVEYIDSEGDIKNIKWENEGGKNYGVAPLIVTADLISDKFIQNAGNKYLFNVGELIGPQMELYQEGERNLPVEQSYCRSYYREIDFSIPFGYRIVNPEDLNINVIHGDESDPELKFVSEYTKIGNQYHVEIDEYYEKLDIPLDEFKGYQDVVNAAADFNKIVLIIEKI